MSYRFVEGIQFDTDPLLAENLRLRRELQQAKAQIEMSRWSYKKLDGDDAKTRFYTGLHVAVQVC